MASNYDIWLATDPWWEATDTLEEEEVCEGCNQEIEECECEDEEGEECQGEK